MSERSNRPTGGRGTSERGPSAPAPQAPRAGEVSETPIAKPKPVPDERSAGYWAAAAEHVLAVPRCSRCGGLSMPPGPVCPHCRSTEPDFQFVPVHGGGTIRSWTLVRDAFLPGFRDDVPYLLVDVALDEYPNVRLIGRLVDGPDAPVHLGDAVTVTFDDLDDDAAVPAFTLAR